MKLVIGLGNPGTQYQRSRHNVGFMIIDEYVNYHKGQWLNKDRFKADIWQLDDVIYAKPQTFMNLSGQAVHSVVSFYKIAPEDILVISDDIDLEFGTVRVRKGGGDGGHNGLKSIIEHIGVDFWRLRIGVANQLREHMEASDFVLKNFSKDEQTILNNNMKTTKTIINQFIDSSLETVSLRLSQ